MINNHLMMSNSTVQTEESLLLSNVRLVVKFYIWPLFAMFGLTGNCLSILVLTRRRLIRTSTNNYLTILAAFDSCYLIFTLILNFGTHSSFSKSKFTEMILFLVRPLADFSSNTATWLIVCFTLERTLAVAKPIYAKRTCSVRRSRRVICTLLVLCFLVTVPTYFEHKVTRGIDDLKPKSIVSNTTKQRHHSIKHENFLITLHRLYLVFICVIIIWIPLLVLIICNTILIWYVRRSRHAIDGLESIIKFNSYSNGSLLPLNSSEYSATYGRRSSYSHPSSISLKSTYAPLLRRHSRCFIQKRKVTIILIVCLFVALILWTPQSLSLTYETLIESYDDMSPERLTVLLIFNNFANLFLCINASIDFILYCFLSEKFARTCRQIICRSCRNHETYSTPRSRLMSVDRPSLILSNLSHSIQPQVINRRASHQDISLYRFDSNSSTSRTTRKTKVSFRSTLTSNKNTRNQGLGEAPLRMNCEENF